MTRRVPDVDLHSPQIDAGGFVEVAVHSGNGRGRHAQPLGLQREALVERHVGFVEQRFRARHMPKLGESSDVVDMTVRRHDRGDGEAAAIERLADPFHFVARIDDDRLSRFGVTENDAVTLQGADRKRLEDGLLMHGARASVGREKVPADDGETSASIMIRNPIVDDKRDAAARALDDRIRNFIVAHQPVDVAFERLALDLFAYQYERNEPYKRYCEQMGRRPGTVKSWRDVPALPAASFGAARLASFPPDRDSLTFISSGTTSAGANPSTHRLDASFLYDLSLINHFRERVLPDATSMRMIFLAPSFQEAPHSSLSYMMSKAASVVGDLGSGFFVQDGSLKFDALCAALREGGGPLVVFGTAFAFVHLFDRCREERIHFRLPIGSRVVETGGFKGKSREIARDELYAQFGEFLGVPRVLCLSEYGMCELGSQWYDANLCDYFAGRAPRVDVKMGPAWARATIVDPVTAEPLPAGKDGLVQIFDLSNRASVAAVLTADVGHEQDGGIVLVGRFAGAPPKGCSIAADAALNAADD